jgi:hypothetical protein
VKEKDAGTETALVVTACGDHASYGGLAGSSYAVQPVDALVAITVASGRHTAHKRHVLAQYLRLRVGMHGALSYRRAAASPRLFLLAILGREWQRTISPGAVSA